MLPAALKDLQVNLQVKHHNNTSVPAYRAKNND